MLNTSL